MPSDYGHEQTDKLLKELEKRIDKEYSQAAKEVQEKFYAHMKDFERKDAKMQEKLDAGKITETEYQNWRTNQMLTGQRMNALYESLAKDLVNADQIAAGMINDSLPDVYALNMNYSTYKIEHTTEIDTNFTLYDRKTVENLMKDNPRIIPHLTEKQAARIKKDELWNRQHLVSAVAQGILQGEGIPDIAKRLQTVAAMDDNAATRNARTYITAAQNKGRIDSYERAEKLGIKTNKKWIATLDDRTRVEHRHLDGVSIPYSDVFKMDGYEIEYPGDPSAEPEMIYNCRCTLVDDIKNWPYNDERNDSKLGDMTYEEWKHAKDKKKDNMLDNINSVKYSTKNIIEPVRPHRSDFDSENDYELAKQKYREDREIFHQQMDDVVNSALQYERFESKEEVLEWAEKNGITITSDALKKTDIRAFNETSVVLDEMFKRFPEVKDYKIEDYDGKIFTREFWIDVTNDGLLSANGGFNFNPKYFENYENGLREAFGGQVTGFLVRADGTFGSLVRHEYGHNVDGYIREKIIQKYHHKDNDWRRNFETFEDWKKADDAYWNEYKRYENELRSLAGLIGSSEYSNTNELELFAEGFAEYTSGGDSEFAKAFGEFLRRWY